MGKTLKKLAPLAILALPVAPFLAVLAPIVGAGAATSLLTAVAFGAVFKTIGNFTRGGNRSTAQDLGTRLTLSADPSAPRIVCYGRAATAGTLVFRDVVGSSNEDLWLVIALAGHEITSIEKFTWGGTAITFSSNNAVGTLNNLMFRYDKLGLDAQTVETNLDTASSKWTSNHRLRGIAYIVLKLVYDPENNNQIKNPVCTIKGRKLYDPRLDSTNGGSGTHRLTDQSTWAWSENPVLCIADYLRGIRVANSSTTSYDGQIIAGMAVADTRIDWANIIAEANSCEESITLNTSGTEDRYTCNGFIDPRRTHRENLEALASSMGGTVVFQSGKWRVYSAVSRAAVKSRDQNDILSGIEYRSKKSRAEKANAVRGVYADVNAEFQPRDIIPLVNSTYVTEDGGDELWMDVNLPFTTSATMAQRLAKIALERGRREKRVSAAFSPIALQDQAMDSIIFSYTPLGLTDQKMRAIDWQMQVARDESGNRGIVFPMVLEEEDDAIYAWNETVDEQAIPAAVTVTRVQRLPDDLSDLAGVIDTPQLANDAVGITQIAAGVNTKFTELDTQVVTLTNANDRADFTPTAPLNSEGAGHEVQITADVDGRSTGSVVDFMGVLLSIRRRIDGGSWTVLSGSTSSASFGGNTFTNKQIVTDFLDNPGAGSVEYQITVVRTTDTSEPAGEVKNANITIKGTFFK